MNIDEYNARIKWLHNAITVYSVGTHWQRLMS